MSARGDTNTAELRKLAHTLGVDTDRLAMVAAVPAQDLRMLRAQVAEALFQADRHHFTRVAALAKAVPAALAARLAEAVFPPLLGARTAELLDPRKAAELVGRVSESYLADVAMAMDAARAPEVIAAIAPQRVARVGAELARRREWIVIGGFVSQVGDAALAAAVGVFDGEQLLRIGLVLDDMDRMDDIATMLRDEQIDQMLSAAAQLDLWTELTNVFEHLSGQRLVRLARHYAAAAGEVQGTFGQAAARGDLDAALLGRLAGR